MSAQEQADNRQTSRIAINLIDGWRTSSMLTLRRQARGKERAGKSEEDRAVDGYQWAHYRLTRSRHHCARGESTHTLNERARRDHGSHCMPGQ